MGPDGNATIIFYHNNIPHMAENNRRGPVDSRVTYLYSVDKDGNLHDMLNFQLMPQVDDSGYLLGQSWSRDHNWDTWSGGWLYGKGNLGPPAAPGDVYKVPDGSGSYQIGWPLSPIPKDEIVEDKDVPFLKIKTKQSDIGFVETISDKGHTQALQFVYSGPDRTKAIQRTYGHNEKDDWVQTTTRFEDLKRWLKDKLQSGYGGRNEIGEDEQGIWVKTPQVRWTIDTNPRFLQYWHGWVNCDLKKEGTIDGVEKYRLEKVTSFITWYHIRDWEKVDWGSTDETLCETLPCNFAPQPDAPQVGVTVADLKNVVSRWNTRADLS
jgi:hypothetical protein